MNVEPDFDRWLGIRRANIDRVGPRAASTDRVHQSAKPFFILNFLEASAPPNASEDTHMVPREI